MSYQTSTHACCKGKPAARPCCTQYHILRVQSKILGGQWVVINAVISRPTMWLYLHLRYIYVYIQKTRDLQVGQVSKDCSARPSSPRRSTCSRPGCLKGQEAALSVGLKRTCHGPKNVGKSFCRGVLKARLDLPMQFRLWVCVGFLVRKSSMEPKRELH